MTLQEVVPVDALISRYAQIVITDYDLCRCHAWPFRLCKCLHGVIARTHSLQLVIVIILKVRRWIIKVVLDTELLERPANMTISTVKAARHYNAYQSGISEVAKLLGRSMTGLPSFMASNSSGHRTLR